MHAVHDTMVMVKRSLRHTIRSMDTIITVALSPIALLLLFVYVLKGTLGNVGDESYVNYITPGIIVMCIVSGIAYSALRLNGDLRAGIINRFRTMPIAPSSILGGHVVSSVLSNLFSALLVLAAALLVGFRSDADIMAWLAFGGLLTLFTAAVTWMAMVFGLLAKSAEGAGSFSYILLLLLFISSAFTPTEGMNNVLRAFAENQPMTPIVETMRSLLVEGVAGPKAWVAVAWSSAILIVFYLLALRIYKKSTA
ncbi:MAG TPA: ABC transporter permease [Candidatus Saccharimonadales bacterium]|nr:ABC transporter permease [Candidatus Saccharimonadales bacterium]